MIVEIKDTITYWELEAKSIAIDIIDFAITCETIEGFKESIDFLRRHENVDDYFDFAYMRDCVYVFQQNRAIDGNPIIEHYIEITPRY